MDSLLNKIEEINNPIDDKTLYSHVKNLHFSQEFKEIKKQMESFYKEFPEFEKLIGSSNPDPNEVKALLDKIEQKYPGFKFFFNMIMEEEEKKKNFEEPSKKK